jgi:hypothetical protein
MQGGEVHISCPSDTFSMALLEGEHDMETHLKFEYTLSDTFLLKGLLRGI